MGAGSWFVAHASGYGWTAGVGVAAMVGAMQLLLPRLELSLEARSGLRGMALVGILSGIAALVAAAGLVMAFGPPSVHPAEAPPLLWLPYAPGSYAWRLPVLLVVVRPAPGGRRHAGTRDRSPKGRRAGLRGCPGGAAGQRRRLGGSGRPGLPEH